MNATVNVPRILAGMKANGWGVAATCVKWGTAPLHRLVVAMATKSSRLLKLRDGKE